MDSALGKIRSRARGTSVSERRGSDDSGRRLSAIIPRRKRSKSKVSDDERKLGLEASSSHPNLTLAGNRSDTSLGLNGSSNSSLLTDDDLETSRKPVRPTLSPHQSHIGYLTLSSPEINSIQNANPVDQPSLSNPPFAASAPVIPHIVEPLSNAPDIPPEPTKDRASSPVGKLRAKLSRKRSGNSLASSRGSSPERGELADSPSRSNSISPAPAAASNRTSAVPVPQLRQQQGQVDASPERPAATPKKKSGRPRLNTPSNPPTPPGGSTTPKTLVTPPTPTDFNAEATTFSTFQSSAGKIPSPTKSLASAHRRSQSANPPSKLSQSTAPPLTPTTEEVKTPGGTLTTGFFSSFITVAQKAADQFSFSPSSQNEKLKAASTQAGQEQGGEEVIPGLQSRFGPEETDGLNRSSAIETLGRGDLNFSHLGLDGMPSNVEPSHESATVTVTEANKAEEDAANRAVSAAYEKPVAPPSSQVYQHARPLSISSNDRLTLADQSPPRPGAESGALQRSGSVRSRLSGRRRRHRASSATAGTTNSIGAALAASATGLAIPAGNGAGHRLTGFAVASSKRNKEFHQLFRSVPEDDYLIEDYSAALQRDILLHGRLYVSEGHICFSSNILGWVTNLVISFDEVVSVEKKSTAVIFPNAIVIQTLHGRNTFASFVARDSTYELLIGIWKISHPNLKSSLNGVTLDDAGVGDKTEVADGEGSEGEEDDTGSDDEVYDEDDDDDAGSLADAATAPSYAGSEAGEHPISRKPSNSALTNIAAPPANGTPKSPEGADAVASAATSGADFPGPAAHEPTSCSDEHYDRPIADATIGAPLGKIYSLVYGPASGAFMKKWLVEDQKSRELNYVDDKTGINGENKTFTFDYIKPLYAPVGPKQTKCITTSTVLAFDLEKAITIDCSTSTPDVPSGNVFVTKTRYCLMWAPGNSTRMVATCTIEWSGKSWLKGPIEKGANDGQIDYVKSLVAALSQAVTSKTPSKAPVGKKGKRKGKKESQDIDPVSAQREISVTKEEHKTNWGPLEPVHALLDPIISLVRPFVSAQVVIAVLFVLLVYTWVNPPRAGSHPGVGFPGFTHPERLAAYEEIWRREESQLWDWLEDRVGLHGASVPGVDNSKQKVLNARDMGKKLQQQDERMNERQMDDAIRVTSERLEALKEAVASKKTKKTAAGN